MDMETSSVEPTCSWAEHPFAQPTIERLEALFDTSNLKKYGKFQNYIKELHALKAPEASFGIHRVLHRTYLNKELELL